MMKKHLFLASAVALALLTGCNNNEYEGMDIPGSELQVRAGINEMSRLSDTGMEWTVGDAIGVSQSGADATDLNIKYTATSTQGAFSSTTGIFVKGDGNVTYTAYYPYSGEEGKSAGTISFDLTKKGNYDFMFAEATASREKPEADFKFEHKMSRVALTITETPAKEEEDSEKAASRAGEDEITVTLRGVVVDGTFDTETGEVTPGKTTGDISVTGTLGEKVYFILPAFEKANTDPIELVITKGDQAYGGTFTPGLESSTEYQYTVDLKETTGAMKVSGEIISGWTPKEEGAINVGEQEAPNTLEIGDFILADGSDVDKDTDITGLDVVGVVYYVGDVYPSSLYGYDKAMDVLLEDCPNAKGLALAINNATNGSATSGRFGAKASGTNPLDFAAWLESEGLNEQYIATTLNATSASDRMLGYNNTKVMELANADAEDEQQIASLTSDFMAFLTSYREAVELPDATSDWYLPSYAEWAAIQTNYEAISSSIKKAGGELPQYSTYNGTSGESTEMFYWSSDIRGVNYAWVSPLVEVTEATNLYITKTSNGTKGFFRFAFAF